MSQSNQLQQIQNPKSKEIEINDINIGNIPPIPESFRNSVLNNGQQSQNNLSLAQREFFYNLQNIQLKNELERLFQQRKQDNKDLKVLNQTLYFVYDTLMLKGNDDSNLAVQRAFDDILSLTEQYKLKNVVGKTLNSQKLVKFFEDFKLCILYCERQNCKQVQKLIMNQIDPTWPNHLHRKKEKSNQYAASQITEVDEDESKQKIILLIEYMLEKKEYKIAKRILQRMSQRRLVTEKFFQLEQVQVDVLLDVLDKKFKHKPSKNNLDNDDFDFDSCAKFIYHFVWGYGRRYILFPENESVIIHAYKQRSFMFFRKYTSLESFETSSESFIKKAIEYLQDPQLFAHGLFGLNFLDFEYLSDASVNLILDNLQEISIKKVHYIHMTVSPFQTTMTLCLIAEQLRKNYKRQSIRFEDIRDNLMQLVIIIQDSIKDFLVLEQSYLQCVYPAQYSPYKIILQHQVGFKKLLEDDFFEKVTLSQFSGNYDYSFLSSFSSSSANLNMNVLDHRQITQRLSKVKKTLKKQNTGKARKSEQLQQQASQDERGLRQTSSQSPGSSQQSSIYLQQQQKKRYTFLHFKISNTLDTKKQNSMFQFSIWKNSPQVISVLNWLLFLIMLVFIMVTVLQYFTSLQDIIVEFPQDIIKLESDYRDYLNQGHIKGTLYKQVLANVKEENQDYESLSQASQEQLIHTYIKQFDTISFWEAIKEILPSEKNGVEKALQLIDNMHETGVRFLFIPLYFIAVFIASLLEISNLLKVEYKVGYLNRHIVDFCQVGLQIYNGIVVIYYINNDSVPWKEKIDYITNIEKLVAITIFLITMKLFQMMKIFKRFGIFIKIMELCVFDIFNFIIVFLLQLFAWAAIFYTLFQGSTSGGEYDTYQDTLFNLNNFVLGQFDFTFTADETLGKILVFLFVYMNNILFINLLIAILSNTFQAVTDKGNAEYGKIINQERKFIQTTKYYTGLICMPSPLNLLCLPLQVLLLFKDSKKLNNFVIKFIYLLILILILFPVFLTLNLVFFIPLGYLNHIFDILNNDHEGKCKKVMQSFVWLIIGLPIMILILLFNDLPLFFVSLFQPMIKNQKLEEFDRDHVRNIKIICIQLMAEKQKEGKGMQDQHISKEQFLEKVKQIDHNEQFYPQYDILLTNFLNFQNQIHYGEVLHILKLFKKYSMNSFQTNIWVLALYNSQWTTKSIIDYQNSVIENVRPEDGKIEEFESVKNFVSNEEQQQFLKNK